MKKMARWWTVGYRSWKKSARADRGAFLPGTQVSGSGLVVFEPGYLVRARLGV